MREFILRARRGPTSPDFDLLDLPAVGHFEVVAHCVSNALFYANHIRDDTVIHIVLDGPSDPPKTVTFDGRTLGSLEGFDEQSIAKSIRYALEAGQGLDTNDALEAIPGLTVAKRGFERLLQDRSHDHLFYLDRKGADIREMDFGETPSFVFTDFLSMPRKTDKYLRRLGATPVSLGPRLLFASHCIVLVHNELDRRCA